MKKAVWEGTDDRLSRAVSAVVRELRSADETYRDIMEVAHDSDLCKLVRPRIERDLASALRDNGYTPKTFIEDVEERTSAKFVYFMGLYQVEDLPWPQ